MAIETLDAILLVAGVIGWTVLISILIVGLAR